MLAAELADDRQPEHQIRAEHPQVPVRRVVVVQRDGGHQRVQRDRAGVVGDDQRAALVRHVVQAGGLDAEPRPVQRPQERQQHVVGEVGVEAELVDGVVAGQAPAQEGKRGGERRLPVGRERSGVGLGGLAGVRRPVRVDASGAGAGTALTGAAPGGGSPGAVRRACGPARTRGWRCSAAPRRAAG